MKTRLFAFIVFISLISVPLFAKEHIIDNAGIMDPGWKTAFEEKFAEIASAYNFDLMILTEQDIGGADTIDYSWAFLDKLGLSGDRWDGCLLLLVTGRGPGERDYVFTASGRGDKILNSTAFNRLESKVLSHLRNSDFTGAYNEYVGIWEEYLILDAKGRSYNFFTRYNFILVLISWVISLITGLIVVNSWKAPMNTVFPKTSADRYLVPDSISFTNKQDKFLYSTVTKTKKQQAPTSSSGRSSRSGGGRSSRGGKF